jgi:hypothetical protein
MVEKGITTQLERPQREGVSPLGLDGSGTRIETMRAASLPDPERLTGAGKNRQDTTERSRHDEYVNL